MGLPVYRLVAFHAPGIQDWQFEALNQPWDQQPIGDAAFLLSWAMWSAWPAIGICPAR